MAGTILLLLVLQTSLTSIIFLSPASGGMRKGLGVGVKEAFASDDENPDSLENVPPDVQESLIAATQATKTRETKSPADPPYHFWVMAFSVLATAIVVTVLDCCNNARQPALLTVAHNGSAGTGIPATLPEEAEGGGKEGSSY